MKVALFAVNASYSHTNLALRCLRAPLLDAGHEVVLIEKNASDTDSALLDALIFSEADVYGFSCYIWNIDKMLALGASLKKLCPKAKIIFGGPEASFDTERLEAYPFIDCVICGEGEAAFANVCGAIREGKAIEKIICAERYGLSDGILYDPDEEYRRLVYYESSRGCPYSCAYCLSSATRGVIAKSAEQTLAELYEFEKFDGDITVKLVDRTFNFNAARANTIWRGLLDPKYTKKYHFEVCASLLDEESFEILSKFPKGKLQLEVGLQSTNEKTLAVSARHIKPDAVLAACRRVLAVGNVHLHLDLICGLPGDTYGDIAAAFDEAYSACSLLQVGFLKLLRGTPLRDNAEKLGIVYRDEPPYEVLCTRDISYAELRRLHEISDILERYRDSEKFELSLSYILEFFESPFKFFEGLLDYIAEHDGRQIRKIGQNDAYRHLFAFAASTAGIDESKLDALLHEDFSRYEIRRAPNFKKKEDTK